MAELRAKDFVRYTGHGGEREYGRVVRVGDPYVFVQYEASSTPQATKPEQLERVPPSEAFERIEPCGNECELPDDCPHCKRYVCSRCNRVYAWTWGAADDTPALCDPCAGEVQEGWDEAAGA